MKKKEKIRQRRQLEKEGGVRKERINWHVKKSSLIMAAVFFVFAVFVAVWQILTVSFDETVGSPELREKYVVKIVNELGKPKGVDVVYIGTPEKIEFLKKEHNYKGGEKILMAVLKNEEVIPGELRKKFTPEMIVVFPYAFSGEVLKTGEDFKSSLLHEYRHIETYLTEEAGGIRISVLPLILEGNEGLFSAVTEMDAIREELKSGLKLSVSYQEDRYRHYLENYSAIWESQWNADADFIEGLKIKFFEPWMRGRPEMKAEIIAGRKSWYLEHPATKRRYYLPKDLFPGN